MCKYIVFYIFIFFFWLPTDDNSENEDESDLAKEFIAIVTKKINNQGPNYIQVIQHLDKADQSKGVEWLTNIQTNIFDQFKMD